MTHAVVSDLKALLGADRVDTDPLALAGRALDAWPLRLVQRALGRQAPLPLCLLRPQNTAQVAAALACLHRHGVATVPCGGGSGVAGGAQPPGGSAVLDTADLDQILGLDEPNLSVTAQAGVRLGRLEAWLATRGYTTGHAPQSIDLAQLGGLVATRSAGQFAGRYGQIEDLLLGLEAVLPDGEILRIAATPRRSAGPDLRHLWLGSEGAFGVVTEVTLRIWPQPEERWLQAYALPDMAAGLAALQACLRPGWRPAALRLHDSSEACRHFPGCVEPDEVLLLLLSEGPAGYPAAEGAALDRILRAAGARPLGPEPVSHWLEQRSDVRAFQRLISMGVVVDTVEVAARWTALPGLYEAICDRLHREVPELLVVSAHCAHAYPQGASLHFTVAARGPAGPEGAERVYWAIWNRVMESTLAAGGSICHHHGIGKLRTLWLPGELGTSYQLLQRLKAAVDPQGLMNPGTLLP